MVSFLSNCSQVNLQNKLSFGNKKVSNNNSNVIAPSFKGEKDSFEASSAAKNEPVNLKEFIPRLKKASQFMQDFTKILEEDQKREVPVLKNVSKDAIGKLFNSIIKSDSHPVMVGVSGGSASGKTTVAKAFLKNLNEKGDPNKPIGQLISQDNYYYDMSDEIKEKGADRVFKEKDLDCPQAVELDLLAKHVEQLKQGKEVKIPEYLLNGTGVRTDNKIPIKPSPLTIVEGLFTLGHEKLNQLYDLKVFVDASREVREQRWWARASERDMKKDETGMTFFNRTFNNHDKYVEPTKANADMVVSSEASQEDQKTVFQQLATALTKPISFTGLLNKFKKAA